MNPILINKIRQMESNFKFANAKFEWSTMTWLWNFNVFKLNVFQIMLNLI